MSGKQLNTDSLLDLISDDTGINLPEDARARANELARQNEAKLKAKKKKKAQERALAKKVKALERVEKKTEKLLEKSRASAGDFVATGRQSAGNPKAPVRQPPNQHFLKTASRIEFLTQKGIPKVITRYIQTNAFRENGQWLAVLDTDELKRESGKPAKQISNAVDRLKAQGWFEIIESKRYGVRLIKIKPEHYNLAEAIQ